MQCINAGNLLSDAFRVPPVSQLGYVHVAMMYKFTASSTYQGPYEIAVVASQATTTNVQISLNGPESITLSFDSISGYTNGDVIAFSLQQYEIGQVKSGSI